MVDHKTSSPDAGKSFIEVAGRVMSTDDPFPPLSQPPAAGYGVDPTYGAFGGAPVAPMGVCCHHMYWSNVMGYFFTITFNVLPITPYTHHKLFFISVR